MKYALMMLSAAAVLRGQTPSALLQTAAVNQLCQRATQLLEAGGVAVPDLARAAAPVIENVRQACVQLRSKPGQGQATYAFLMNLRAYLTLAEAVPKPFPFPEAARQQFAEMREEETRLDAHFRALLESKETQLVSADRDNLARYAEDNRRLGPPQAGKARVVFLGDSITDSWRLNEYFPDRDFVNRGIGGQITGQMLGRMKADVIDLHPAAVVILGGTNDLAREVPLTAIEDNYVLLADLAAAAKIKVVFSSVTPVSDLHKDADPSYQQSTMRPPVFIKALNDWLQSFCAQRGYVFLNYVPALADAQGQFGAELSDDGLHPNSKGYRLMAPLALQAVDRAVGAAIARPAAPAPAPAAVTSKKKK
ncbi:MAG TPA: GDSL-type esterase/lipase family protein [Bryobacteraceae bacterium]|jgi:lysophospholipase L1-like esterase